MLGEFNVKLERKLKEQIKAKNVGFLLGAGASFLNGEGYPLAGQLWARISDRVPETERAQIQEKLDQGAAGIEKALDLLDTGGVHETTHRACVVDATAAHFCTLYPPLSTYRTFLSALKNRRERHVHIFTLNYDPLVERAAELEKMRVFDGFQGHERAFFDPSAFEHDIAIIQRTGRALQRFQIEPRIMLMKLHGSLGWYECPTDGTRRGNFNITPPANSRRLMIPPQYRKATDTVHPPYSMLWSEYRKRLVLGPDALNRLVTIGYGMMDEHVNDVIEGAMARTNFTLVIVALELTDTAFARWSSKRNAIIVTRDRCSLYGEIGAGHGSLWSFENIVQEI